MKSSGCRNLTQVSDFPYVYTKRRCGPAGLLELARERRRYPLRKTKRSCTAIFVVTGRVNYLDVLSP